MPSPQPRAYVTHSPSPVVQQSQSWFIDYGVTNHITTNVTHLMHPISTTRDDHVLLGNGQGLPIHFSGFATFSPSTHPYCNIPKEYY